MPLSFACACCLDQHDGAPAEVIGAMEVCEPCVTDSIMPLFHGALKYEAQYPPMFGPFELYPDDFADYFDDMEAFMQEWDRKTREYETPYKARVYCSGCEAFLCAKPKDDAKPKIRCGECNALTCYPCGANATESVAEHVCPGAPDEESEKTENPFNGMQRGKEYQLCPNPECGTPVELRDGCNHMVCESTSCGTNFCFLCGEKIEPHSGHWNAGSKCSRYNHPDAQNAIYDADNTDPMARMRAALDEGLDDEMGILAELAPPRDLLFDTMSIEAYSRLIQMPVGMMNDVPALPDLTGQTEAQQRAIENSMREQLEASALGRLMLEHRRELDHMLNLAHVRTVEAEDEGFPVPAHLPVAVSLLVTLRHNLHAYIYRVDVRNHLDAFVDRHEELEAAYGVHQAAIFAQLPRFYEILTQYSTVAEIRILGAESALEGGNADAVEREEVEALMGGWEAQRLLDAGWV